MKKNNKKQIHIFAGHFGSGKTETALNFARRQREAGKSVVIIDIDTVNPYFRTNDAEKTLKKLGIRLISTAYASTNIDMPIVPPSVLGVFDSPEEIVIFDVGGDEDGAYALGQYCRLFEEHGFNMHFVINTRRPLTPDVKSLLEMAGEIENASRLRFCDIYNNTNIADETDTAVLLSGGEIAEELGRQMGIPVAYHCGTKNTIAGLPKGMKAFEMNITIKNVF
ncbi:MAG: hypothetical protein PUF72_03990 [Clostridiales bacterium]|nr:hypothetical protein [Clostridiales bacterium]